MYTKCVFYYPCSIYSELIKCVQKCALTKFSLVISILTHNLSSVFTYFSTPSDMGWWKTGILWRDFLNSVSLNTYEQSLKIITSYSQNLPSILQRIENILQVCWCQRQHTNQSSVFNCIQLRLNITSSIL